MEQTIFEALTASAALAALVGTRIYGGGVASQNVATPFLTFSIVSTVPENQLDNASAADQLRIQVDAFAVTYEAAHAVARAARAALTTAATLNALFLNEVDVNEPDEQLYRVVTDFGVWSIN